MATIKKTTVHAGKDEVRNSSLSTVGGNVN
jgi:hypothetical protein